MELQHKMDGSDAFNRRTARRLYEGSRRKIVIAFDIGTTFSGISYCILDPGQHPIIKGVTRFPAQEQSSGASKIPSIVYYNESGAIKAIGAEAIQEGIIESAAENGWYKAEWFKLHLRDKDYDVKSSGFNVDSYVPPLPPNTTVVDIFADFLSYLFSCAREYIKDSHPTGQAVWSSSIRTNGIDFVISHPNGWEGKEQAQMRKAVVKAKLVPDTDDGHSRVSFVTEGEASLHFAIESGILAENVQAEGVIIVDAGGGTVDVSTYGKTVGPPNSFNEIATPECHFHGSVFVTLAARKMLEEYLKDSPYFEDIDHVVRCFDLTTKLRFSSTEAAQYIKFGSTRDMDVEHNIRFGQLKLLGSTVGSFFKPSVDCIVKVVKEHQKIATTPVSHVVLTGGFAASDWLFKQVKAELHSSGLVVLRPQNHTHKAVSDGAVSYHLDHYVRARIARWSYGEFSNTLYDDNKPDHRIRSSKKVPWKDGTVRIPDHFHAIVSKGTQVLEKTEFKMKLYNIFPKDNVGKQTLNSTIWCYKGNQTDPQWRDGDPDGFQKVCTLHADLSQLPMKKNWNLRGSYYRVEYSVIIHFGLTEMEAQLEWSKSGQTCRSPAKLIFD
ncbi:hypothetical protein CPB83DRAFT_799420 [Crepidotus variabilis]|uniref:Heat shock 70 kDa protein 12A n=1 Tax=Crepidotus variabilis TaxID=179855 RepID=A0A9P6JJL2_9AGAR|nr:hypothetical protein CPB83DRAFT_799420 [Crepidotus variabilis]